MQERPFTIYNSTKQLGMDLTFAVYYRLRTGVLVLKFLGAKSSGSDRSCLDAISGAV